jgi:CHAT domain-containing protein
MRIPLIKILCATSMMVLPIMPTAHAQFTFGQGAGKSQQPSSDGRSRSNQASPFSIFDHFNFTNERPKSSPERPERSRSPREVFEDQFAQVSPEDAVREFEALQQKEFTEYTQTPLQSAPSAAQISRQLAQIAQETGTRPAVLYTVALEKQTHLLLVLPASSPFAQAPPQAQQAQYLASTQLLPGLLAQNETPPVIRQVLPEVSRETVLDVAKSFRQSISNPTELDSTNYLNSAQQLYRWIVKPLEPQLQSDKIDTLLFSMDEGLRTIPLGALHDGQQFLVEQYSTALIPSFGLTNTNRSLALKQQPMLAMGISKSTEGLAPLPAVPAEISAITNQLWTGPSRETLNEASTLDNLKQLYQQQRFGVLHLATHAVFNPGQVDNSYIQFWDDRLTLSKIRRLSTDLRWNQLPSLELLVLSACQTALGNKEAELGFAGTAINAGVPAAIASLWSVEDRGTFGLMTGFYDALQSAPTKAKALQQAQIRMLRGEISLQNGQMILPNHAPIDIPDGIRSTSQLMHPYFWSSYTVVGNWN